MSGITTIKNEADLKQYINLHSPGLLTDIQQELGVLEAEYNAARKQRNKGLYLAVSAFVIAPIFSLFPALALVCITVGFAAMFYGLKLILVNQHTISKFQQIIDQIIFTKVLTLFSLTGSIELQPIGEDPAGLFAVRSPRAFYNFLLNLNRDRDKRAEIVLERLTNSELITEPHNRNEVDTDMSVFVADKSVQIAELDIEQVTGSGKNKHTKQIFHGYFASIPLNRHLTGKTFVSAEGDTNGFGGVNFWNKSINSLPQETLLEWNEFENMLHVATTNETEARYVLTPDFMHHLYEWWKEHDTNIRISFIATTMHVLFPDDKVRLGYGLNADLTEENLAEYMYSIARPLWHVIRLVEKVRL